MLPGIYGNSDMCSAVPGFPFFSTSYSETGLSLSFVYVLPISMIMTLSTRDTADIDSEDRVPLNFYSMRESVLLLSVEGSPGCSDGSHAKQ